MSRREYLLQWSKVHGFSPGSEVAGVARWYLSLNFYLVQPLIFLKLSPNLVTLIGPLLAAGALLSESDFLIALLVFASLLVDGFDGAVALIRGDRKSTRLNSSHVSESRMPSSA